MAGVKGRSGGARVNSGGKRVGAGAKKKVVPPFAPAVVADAVVAQLDAGEHSMLRLLQKIALGLQEADTIQVRAAIAAVQYTHTKRHDGGKKEEQEGLAKKAASKFKAGAAPLKLVGAKKA